ncbi:SRPBCC domain-containing protein [Actinoplanes sp. NPDC049596]|uniref:SRPBCC domain-containing protein n=1 Tax=unclassified Actinoplanes TaxID=2626549 RepID=UPI0034335054
MREISAVVQIAAPPARVWQTLTDFASFPAWNPFIRRAEGPLVVGGRLRITLRLGRVPVPLRPRVTAVVEPRQLRWLARLAVPGLFDVDRRFALEPAGPDGCRFHQAETAHGLLAPVLMPLLRRPIRRGYLQLNTALRNRVEQTG